MKSGCIGDRTLVCCREVAPISSNDQLATPLIFELIGFSTERCETNLDQQGKNGQKGRLTVWGTKSQFLFALRDTVNYQFCCTYQCLCICAMVPAPQFQHAMVYLCILKLWSRYLCAQGQGYMWHALRVLADNSILCSNLTMYTMLWSQEDTFLRQKSCVNGYLYDMREVSRPADPHLAV